MGPNFYKRLGTTGLAQLPALLSNVFSTFVRGALETTSFCRLPNFVSLLVLKIRQNCRLAKIRKI